MATVSENPVKGDTQTVHAKNLIGGTWQDAASGDTFESVNPADTREVVGTAPKSSADDVAAAVAAARKAFPEWSATSWVQRGECLDNLSQLIKRDLEDLSRTVTRECGKTINEGRADVVETLHMVQFAAALGRMPIGEVISSEIPEKDAYIRRKPKGVIGCITPWNFPMAIPMWEMTPSLIAGNTCILKPSEETPICAHRLFELMVEAGFPPGVVNIVHGFGADAGAPLASHPDVNVMLFTGSFEVGKKVQQQAASEAHKFVATEMGGKNAVMVLDDADLDIAVPAGVLSAFKTAGQRCVTSGRLIVDEKVIDQFQERFLKAVDRIKIGNGLDEDVFMGPLINAEGITKYERHNQAARSENAEILRDGGRHTDDGCEHGHFVKPFVYRLKHSHESFAVREEAFSPHVALIPVSGVEEAVSVYNDTEYGLAMAVITESYRKARYVRDNAEYGLGYVNLPSIGAEVHLPFGGVKRSGNGHPSAEGLLDAVTHRTAFTVNHGSKIIMAQGMSADI